MLNAEMTVRRRWWNIFGATVAVAVTVLAGGAMLAAQQPDNSLVELAWAYAIPTEPRPPIVDDGGKHSLPGTPLTFTRNEIRGRDSNDDSIRTAPADWYPGDHPVMPDIVAKGDQSRNVIACALCHYPNGKGRPENANPAGLPKAYFIQQVEDFQSDARNGSEPRKGNYTTMINIAKGMTAEEIEESAEYFSSMTWTSWIDVREAAMVPKTQINRWHAHQAGRRARRNGTDRKPHRGIPHRRTSHRASARSTVGIHRLGATGLTGQG